MLPTGRPRNDKKQQQEPRDKDYTHPVTREDSDKAQYQTPSPVRESPHTSPKGTGHPKSSSCTGIRPTSVCASGAGSADCEPEPCTPAAISDRADCHANTQQAEWSPDLLNPTDSYIPESPSQTERKDRGPTAQVNRPTCNEMEQEADSIAIGTASTRSTPLNAKAACFYPNFRDEDCGGVGSFQPREDPHDSDGRIQREIDISLPTDLSGRDTASATQVTRNGSGHTDEERAIQVNTAG